MLTAEQYNDALMLPSAHRFAEVVEAFANVTSLVAEEATQAGKTSRWVGCHPLVRLYLEQLMRLSGTAPGPHNTWRAAVNFAQKAALGREASTEIGGHHYRSLSTEGSNG